MQKLSATEKREIKEKLFKPEDKVIKRSKKPFKSGKQADIIKEIVINPQSPKGELGALLLESNCIVNLRQLKVLP